MFTASVAVAEKSVPQTIGDWCFSFTDLALFFCFQDGSHRRKTSSFSLNQARKKSLPPQRHS
jgi:hypothetical protein